MFDNFKPQPDELNAEVTALLEKIAGRIPEGSDAVAYAAGNVYRNVTARPRAYLMYGPYWWAVKDILRANGFEVGDVTDSLVAKAYGPEAMGGTMQVLVAATQFAEHYRKTFLQGARDFQVNDDGPTYALYDSDVE